MQIFDNVRSIVRDDLEQNIAKGSRLSIAAATFSIYAYQELCKQLEGIDELRFIFTSQTFTAEQARKERREFYIPRLSRERSLYGTMPGASGGSLHTKDKWSIEVARFERQRRTGLRPAISEVWF